MGNDPRHVYSIIRGRFFVYIEIKADGFGDSLKFSMFVLCNYVIAVLQVVLLNRLSWFDHVTYEHIDRISFSS